MASEHRASSNIELSLAVSLLKKTVIEAIVSQQGKEVKTEVERKSFDKKRADEYLNGMVTNGIKDKNSLDNDELGLDIKRWRSEAIYNCVELCNQNCGNFTPPSDKDNKLSADIKANAMDDIRDELVHIKREKDLLKLEVDALMEGKQKLEGVVAETHADCQFLTNKIKEVKDELICVKREKELLKLEVNALKEGRGELKGELAETITDCESLAKIIKEKKDLIEGCVDGKIIDTAVNPFDKQNKSAVPRVGALKRKVVQNKGPAVKKKKVCKVGEGCLGCSTPECGQCAPCLDRPSRGGKNTLRKRCKLRRCRTASEEPAGGGQVEEGRSCIRALDF